MHRVALAAVARLAIAALPTSAAARTDADPLSVTGVEPFVDGKGLRTQAITGYPTGDTHRFAALWR
jgi:hypothetical protein